MESTRRDFLKTAVVTGSVLGLSLDFPGILRAASAEEISASNAETTGYTYCDGCNHVPKCGIVYHRQGDVITRIYARTDFNYPANTLCSKGYAQLQEQYHPERLRYPLRRTTPKGEGPKWKRITWEEAIRETAD
jgi:anaerobic selenocysteine-containing dehydrogenase